MLSKLAFLLTIDWFPVNSKISLKTLSLFASIKEHIILFGLAFKLRASKELIPIVFMSKLSANAFTVATPILIPVNEPWTYINCYHINI